LFFLIGNKHTKETRGVHYFSVLVLQGEVQQWQSGDRL